MRKRERFGEQLGRDGHEGIDAAFVDGADWADVIEGEFGELE